MCRCCFTSRKTSKAKRQLKEGGNGIIWEDHFRSLREIVAVVFLIMTYSCLIVSRVFFIIRIWEVTCSEIFRLSWNGRKVLSLVNDDDSYIVLHTVYLCVCVLIIVPIVVHSFCRISWSQSNDGWKCVRCFEETQTFQWENERILRRGCRRSTIE